MTIQDLMKRYRLPLVVGLLLFILSAALPPWESVFQAPGLKQITHPAGWAPLWSPPLATALAPDDGRRLQEPVSFRRDTGLRVSISLLFVEWAIISGLTLFLALLVSLSAAGLPSIDFRMSRRLLVLIALLACLVLTPYPLMKLWSAWSRATETKSIRLLQQHRDSIQKQFDAKFASDLSALKHVLSIYTEHVYTSPTKLPDRSQLTTLIFTARNDTRLAIDALKLRLTVTASIPLETLVPGTKISLPETAWSGEILCTCNLPPGTVRTCTHDFSADTIYVPMNWSWNYSTVSAVINADFVAHYSWSDVERLYDEAVKELPDDAAVALRSLREAKEQQGKTVK